MLFRKERLKRLAEDANTLPINRVEMNSKKMGVITSGIGYQYVKEALPDASVLKLGMAYPLPKKLIAEFAEQVEELYVIEEGEPFFEDQIKAMGLAVKGKELFTIQGEYSANMIKKAICRGGYPASGRSGGARPAAASLRGMSPPGGVLCAVTS